MPNQNQDSLLELASKFIRFEKALVYDICAETPDPQSAIDDSDLDLPVHYRLEQIKKDEYALRTFVNKHLDEYREFAGRLAKEPDQSRHAYYASRHCFAVRYGQRARGIPEDQLLPWPELLQRLLAQVQDPDLQHLVKKDMTLIGVPGKLVHDYQIDSYNDAQSGPIISPKVTPPLRKRQNDNSAEKHKLDSEKVKAANKSYVSENGNQSRSDSVSKLKPQRELHLKDILTPIVGDKPYASFRDYINLIQRKNSKPFDSNDERSEINLERNEEHLSSDELIIEALKFAEHFSTYFTVSEPAVSSIKTPETEEAISQWYYHLADYEQCYVQIAAILHGISTHEISQQTDILYQSIHIGAEKRESSFRIVSHLGNDQETQYTETFRFDDISIQRIPGRKLHSYVKYATTRQEMGVDRLYWLDVDQDGTSKFRIDLLAFLTKEFIHRGEQGQKFLKVLYNLSQDNQKSELSLKAAYAYGVVLRCYDQNLFWTRANEWAQMKSRLSWRRTAELLDGAYELECIQSPEKPSVVLRLLESWIAQVHQYLHQYQQLCMLENKTPFTAAQGQNDKDNLTLAINLAWIVANTCELIGKRQPEFAFSGLKLLLQLSQIDSTYYTSSIYAVVVSTYVHLARTGRIHDVLQHLAENAECLSNWYQKPYKTNERLKYRLYRQLSLNATLEAFFIIAAESYFGIQDQPHTSFNLTRSHSPQPSLPDSEDKDVILAGLSSQTDEKLREHIEVLLCATIMQKRSRLAFSVLRNWASVFKKSGNQELIQLIVSLGKRVETWCLTLEKQGIRASPAFVAYKSRIEQWNEEDHLPHIP